MPCSTWEEVAGKDCQVDGCDNLATHYYDGMFMCCECHGRNMVSQLEAKVEHEKIILRKDDEFHKKLSEKLFEEMGGGTIKTDKNLRRKRNSLKKS